MAEYFEKVLTDAWQNIGEDSYEISSDNFVGYEGPSWRISKFALKGGKQQGVDLVEMDNGHMTVVVIPTRGMGILEAFTDDVSLGWNSPVREVVHPAYVRSEERGGLGWLAGFNELVCRCGLSYHGAAGEDVIRTNTGAERKVMLPLHGTIANTPAVHVRVRVQLQPPYELAVVGEVRDTLMFGPSLGLVSTIFTRPGSSEFTVHDVVDNLGGMPTELELLYHCNYGMPLLDKGSQVLAPVKFICPRDARAKESMATWDTYGAPEPGFSEQVYFARLHGDQEGKTVVALVDPQEEFAATIRFSTKELPAFTIWKHTAAERDGYVTGLEPGTDYPNNRRFERSKGRVSELPAEGRYEAQLTFGALSSADEVAQLRSEVAALSKGKESVVRQEPDEDYCPV
jgi:hypothetical protein